MAEEEKAATPAKDDPQVRALMKKLRERKAKDAGQWALWALGALSAVAAGDKQLAAQVGATTPAARKRAQISALEEDKEQLLEKRSKVEDQKYKDTVEQYRYLMGQVAKEKAARIKEIEMALLITKQQADMDLKVSMKNVDIHNMAEMQKMKMAQDLMKEVKKRHEVTGDYELASQAARAMVRLDEPTNPLDPDTQALLLAISGEGEKGVDNLLTEGKTNEQTFRDLQLFADLGDQAMQLKSQAGESPVPLPKDYVRLGDAVGNRAFWEGNDHGTWLNSFERALEQQVAVDQRAGGGPAAVYLTRFRQAMDAGKTLMGESVQLQQGVGMFSGAGALKRVGAAPRLVTNALQTDARLKELRDAANAKGVTIDDQIKKMNKVLGLAEDDGLIQSHYESKLDKLDRAYQMLEDKQDMVTVRGIRKQLQQQPVFQTFMEKNSFPTGTEDEAFRSWIKLQRKENQKKRDEAFQATRDVAQRGTLFPIPETAVVSPADASPGAQITQGASLESAYGQGKAQRHLPSDPKTKPFVSDDKIGVSADVTFNK